MTSDELRGAADALFAAQGGHGRVVLHRNQRLVAEVPIGPNIYLGFIWGPAPGRGSGASSLYFGKWALTPGGERIPKSGMAAISDEMLPAVAAALAKVMDLAVQHRTGSEPTG